jgi:hypothetical protein
MRGGRCRCSALLCSAPADAATHDHPGGACGRLTVSFLQSKSHGADRGAASAGTGSDTVWSGSSSESLSGPQWLGQACNGSGHTALLWCCCGCRGYVACRVTSRAGVWVCGCVGAWVDAMRSTDFACVGPCGVEWMQGRAGRGRGDGYMVHGYDIWDMRSCRYVAARWMGLKGMQWVVRCVAVR